MCPILPAGHGECNDPQLDYLDLDDEDERQFLIEAEHPEMAKAADAGRETMLIRGQDMSPGAHLAIHRVARPQSALGRRVAGDVDRRSPPCANVIIFAVRLTNIEHGRGSTSQKLITFAHAAEVPVPRPERSAAAHTEQVARRLLIAAWLVLLAVGCSSEDRPKVPATTQGIWTASEKSERQLTDFLTNKAGEDAKDAACARLGSVAEVAATARNLPSIQSDGVAAWQRASNACGSQPLRSLCLVRAVNSRYDPHRIGPLVVTPIPTWPTCDPTL